jgi:trichothecene 3-O-acetyltransferase
MSSAPSKRDLSHLHDVMGTMPMLKRYVVICLFFSLNENYSLATVEASLQDALRRLADAFPFLAGQVVWEDASDGSSGIPRIRPYRDTIELLTNDLRGNVDFPSMAKLRHANYPASMLDPTILGPAVALDWTMDQTNMTAPVLVLQANFVKDGVILMFSANHTTTDMTGLGGIIQHFAKACRNEKVTEKELQEGNQDRRNAIPLLGDDFDPGSELDDTIIKLANETERGPPAGAPPRWAYFNFKADALRRLKKEASNQKVVSFISTDDAIGAICWQSIARAREARVGNETSSTLCRVISVRKWFGLNGYLGHMVDCTFENEVDVWKSPLGEVSGRLRRLVLQDEKIKHHAQAFATVLKRTPDKTKLVNGARLNPHKDVVLSSYSNIRCCDYSFGMLGCPDAARRPTMAPWPSLLYLMPKSKRGDIAVAFCVSEDDMTRLRADPVLGEYAEYVG